MGNGLLDNGGPKVGGDPVVERIRIGGVVVLALVALLVVGLANQNDLDRIHTVGGALLVLIGFLAGGFRPNGR